MFIIINKMMFFFGLVEGKDCVCDFWVWMLLCNVINFCWWVGEVGVEKGWSNNVV